MGSGRGDEEGEELQEGLTMKGFTGHLRDFFTGGERGEGGEETNSKRTHPAVAP